MLELVPAFKVKVRSLLDALSALTASLNRIPTLLPGVAVTETFAPRTTSPVTLKAPLPKLMSPVKVLSALPVVVVVSKVKLLLAPVTAPIIMSPLVSVALVSSVVAAASVIAPKVMSSFELSMVLARVTVPVVFSVSPPLKVKVSLVLLPKVKVPVFWKVTALVKTLPVPLKTKS